MATAFIYYLNKASDQLRRSHNKRIVLRLNKKLVIYQLTGFSLHHLKFIAN